MTALHPTFNTLIQTGLAWSFFVIVDIFLFYIFWELVLIPTYFIIVL